MFVSALSTIAGPKSCLISFATRRSHGRNYDTELQRCRLEAALVDFGDYHPLKPIMVSVLSCISIRFNSLKTCRNIVVVFFNGPVTGLTLSQSVQVTDTKTRRGIRKGSTSSSSSSSSSAPPDPLSSMLDGTDPLSMFAAASASETPPMSHSSSTGVSDLDKCKSWSMCSFESDTK